MQDSKLLSNKRIEKLNEETDYLGILNKGNLIKQFLIGSTSSIEEMKMFALYGDWGSGKSTLMKYLQDELEGDFNTYFFEAWEYEKDENLAMSLLEYITFESNSSTEEFYKGVLKYGGRILRGLGKSVKLNIPLFPGGPAIDLDPSAFVEEMTNEEELSFYEALKKFKIEFQRLEDFTTNGDKPKYNIIFIDDLDRCEPEQVLNLMSAIKLFFTYGTKTIFFCGIDKSAVQAAVKTKYGKAVKSNEYLEKIFDISFSMPTEVNTLKLIRYYFDDQSYILGKDESEIYLWVDDFFQNIEFYNPRRIKKVLNKFQMLRNFKQSSSSFVSDFPNIDLNNNTENSLFETLLVLYLLILHEFDNSNFNDFLNFEKKRQIYLKAMSDHTQGNELTLLNIIDENLSINGFNYIQKISKETEAINNKRFLICISPINIASFRLKQFDGPSETQVVVGMKNIDFLFFKYINRHWFKDWTKNGSSNASFKSVKKLITDLL